jgi:uncharacterized protein (DUF1684 family)
MTVQQPTYAAEIEDWRARAEATLRADDGWLTVAGLFWLQEGPNTIGADPSSDIVLPAGAAPAAVGSITLRGNQAILHMRADVAATVNGTPSAGQALRADADGRPDLVEIGDLTLLVLRRGARFGVRLRDKNSVARRTFGGRRWFPVDAAYRLRATFVPYDPPKLLAISNILGDTSDVPSPGYVVFTLDGQQYQLDASSLSASGLHFVFRDLTSGKETYGSSRFLTVPPPKDGQVTLDFNRAVSPPCAFTDYATCPLPVPQNRLPVRIAAGERVPD